MACLLHGVALKHGKFKTACQPSKDLHAVPALHPECIAEMRPRDPTWGQLEWQSWPASHV